MIYVITFLASSVFFWISEKSRNKYASIFFASIGIIIPCILAGMRADTVGTDVRVYVEPMYNAAQESANTATYMAQRWYVIWRYMYMKDYEVGFSILIFLIQKMGGSFGVVLFVIELLIIAPIYLGLKKLKKPYPISISMLVFYFMFYNMTLNMMRQWIAMAILFMGFPDLINNKKRSYIIYILIACLFHISALFGIAILFVYEYSQRKQAVVRIGRIKLKESMVPIKLFVYGCVALMLIDIIAIIMSFIGFGRYTNYIQGGTIYFLPSQLIVRLPIILLFIIRWRKIIKEDKLAPFYGSMFALDLLASQLLSLHSYAFRISVFFSQFNILSYSATIYAGNRKMKSNRVFGLLYLMAYVGCYWVYYYVISGANETFPYVFAGKV